MLKLYYSPGACALASHIALEESGAEHELVKIDLRQGEQKTPEYLAVNPVGSTPALVTDEGVITENLAIMSYLAQTHPKAGLADVDSPFNFAKMQAFNGFLASSLHPSLSRILFARPPLEGEARQAAVDFALSKLALIEDHRFQGPWALGERFTTTDGYLAVFLRWARTADLLDKTRFPKLNDFLDRVQTRPAVKRALEIEGTPPV